jgi:hypothetical protein
MAIFTGNSCRSAVLLAASLDRIDAQLDLLVYDAFPLPKTS